MPTHQQVAHAWANRTGRQHNGHHMFHRNDTIFSYGSHFPIARLVYVDGRTVVLFTDRDYSVSTAKHKSIVRSACRQFESFPVRDPSAPVTQRDFDALVSSAKVSADKAQRARKYGDMHLESARADLETANRMSAVFGLGRDVVTLETLGVALADLEARLAAAREAEAARRAAAMAERYAAEAERRDAWLAGADARWHGYAADGRSALLRVRGETLETSLGADVPLSHAVKAFRFVKLCRERGEMWRRNGRVVRVGHFTIDQIEPTGDFVAGCHRIAWAEVERIARQLDLLDATASADAVELTHA